METQSTTSGKIKLLFIVLGTVAAISVANFFGSFTHNPFKSGLAALGSSNLENPDEDVDHDGLSNLEESYWNSDFQNPDSDGDGFKDGEEVASGHNPTIPGPNDSLTEINLTEKASDLVLGGLYTGDLRAQAGETVQQANMQAMSSAVIEDFFNSQPDIPRVIMIPGDNSKQGQEIYLTTVSDLANQYLLAASQTRLDTTRSPFEQRIFFTEQAKKFKDMYAGVAQLPVPSDWKTLHHQILDVVQRFGANYEYVALGNSDPMKGVLAISELQSLQTEAQELIKNIQDLIIKNNLKLTGDVFTVLDLLYR